ncbi:MAG: GNAT family N-acetyltransferase [Pseudomonadales bacterium]|nr:GNAT family N-acetyltransferase [Pseudomonadales bacterium]
MTAKSTAISEAGTIDEINRCYALMKKLRPLLIEAEFPNQIGRQQQQGYHLMVLQEHQTPVSLMGYRLVENLIIGKFLYIDDLVTEPDLKQRGHASQLLAWAIEIAKEHSCCAVQLDSGFENVDAHRLYLNHGFNLSAHHLRRSLRDESETQFKIHSIQG